MRVMKRRAAPHPRARRCGAPCACSPRTMRRPYVRGRCPTTAGWSAAMSNRILVVDDDHAIRHLVVNILERAGYDTIEAFDGQDAIEHLDHDAIDGIVLDLMMPRVDGFGVVDHLAATRPEMVEKTVMLTAYPLRVVRERVHHLC